VGELIDNPTPPGDDIFVNPLPGGLNSAWTSFVIDALDWLNEQFGDDENQNIQALINFYVLGNSEADLSFPIGSIMLFAGSSVPALWLNCDGSAISRTTYSALFTAIGTTFGAGDGINTFNVPDTRGRTAIGTGQGTGLTNRNRGDSVGTETHKLSVNDMPSHTHTQRGNSGGSGAVRTAGVAGAGDIDHVTATKSAGGGVAHNNMQPSLALGFIIYAGV